MMTNIHDVARVVIGEKITFTRTRKDYPWYNRQMNILQTEKMTLQSFAKRIRGHKGNEDEITAVHK